MTPVDAIPGVTDDPVLIRLLDGRAATLHEAEEQYLDASLDIISELIASPLNNEELMQHPLLQLLGAHGGRGWEDSIL